MNRGRPKFTQDQHLRRDITTIRDIKEMATQVYERHGFNGLNDIYYQLKIMYLSALNKSDYGRFIRLCRAKLEQ